MTKELNQWADQVSKAYDMLAYGHSRHTLELLAEIRNAMREALAQPKQEPVAWMHVQGNYEELSWYQLDDGEIEMGWKQYPLYTAPPQRTWVGLTDEEIDAIYEQHHNQYGECESPNFGYERAIEEKLKEKNNG